MGFSLKGAIKTIGSAFTPGGGEAADLIPGIGDARAQDKANRQNIQLAEDNRKWQEMMSNTAYQRAMDDMKKSGLNPILAYQQGGASVPSTTPATVSAASKTGLGAAAISAYTGINAAQTQKQQANTAQATSESSISLNTAQTANAIAATEKTKAETAKTIDSIKSEKVKRDLIRQQIPLEKTKAAAAELAQEGTKRVGSIFDSMLKTGAKPNFKPGTLEYENPIKTKLRSWLQPEFKPKGKK